MKIEEAFPEDPFEPTIKYAAVIQTPFTVPWAEGRVQLCAGFNTQRSQDDDLFMKRSAFRYSLRTALQYRECQSTLIKDESDTNNAAISEDNNFAISASIGGSFLGASGRGSYEKSIRDNKNTSNISVRAEHTCGQIDIARLPDLDPNAVRLLNTSPDPVNEFRKMYGDFYVAGYRVGAVNSTTISGELVNKTFFEATKVQVKVTLLFATVSKSVSDVKSSASDVGGLRVSAFDSLTAFYSDFTAHTLEDSVRVGNVAAENKQRAMNIASRASEVLWKEFSISQGATVHQDAVNGLCDRGLITELLLAPFASLREYQTILSLRFNRHRQY